jgi:anion-transporting  ArsA/GET3 family ATPase
VTPVLDVDELLDDPATRVLVCCGAGGVGKTTTSAALALRAAERGRRTVVLTIDPAKRLAQALGLQTLSNEPGRVAGTTGAGELHAMMLDMRRTFDEMVQAHTTPDRAETIIANPFYQTISSSFSGTQEYMAMEKLGQLHTAAEADGRWDLIVVDTPPARSALDFLEAPEHLSALLDGRFLRRFLDPAPGPLRLMSVGFNFASAVMTKVLGAQIIRDVQTFVTAFEALFGGFRDRATSTFALLSSQHTTFLVVATPQRDALREAAYFVDRLSEEQMPLSGLVLNRVHTTTLDVSPERALSLAEDLDEEVYPLEVEALRRHASLMRLIGAEARQMARFSASRPAVAQTRVQSLPTDVTDLAALRRVGDLLADKD